MWTYSHSRLQDALETIDSWNKPDYLGLSHVLQMKLLRDQPHLIAHNAEQFLLYKELFLAGTASLLEQIQIKVPDFIDYSEMFVPCAFASVPKIADSLHRRNAPDCLGRSAFHILYDAKNLSDWLPADTHSSDLLGRTGLYLACRDRNQSRVEQLLRVKANPNFEATNGLYPLDMAAISGEIEIC